MEWMKIVDRVVARMERNRRAAETMELRGIYRFFHWRRGELISMQENHNVITNEGKLMLLDVGLDNETTYTQQTAWYVMLVSNDGPPPAPAATHTYTGFHGTAVTEFSEYTGDRKAYNGVVSGTPVKITNTASRAIFTFVNPTKDVYGAALVSSLTKNDATAGDYLMSWAALPNGVIDAQHDDILNIEIELAFV